MNEEPTFSPAASPSGAPPRKKVRGDAIDLEEEGPMEEPNQSTRALSEPDAYKLMQQTHALVERMEQNFGHKLDSIQAQQKSIAQTVDQHTAQLASATDDIASIKHRVQSLEDHSKADPEVEKLELQVNQLAQQVQEFSQHRASSAPPPARTPPPKESWRSTTMSPSRPRPGAHSPPGDHVDLEVDWNRLVIGGWHLDTRREKIESEARQLLETFDIQASVAELIVYGRRASTCHVLLQPLPAHEAKRRIANVQAQHKDKHIIPSSGKAAWITPHKSATKRLKNRATKHAATMLESLLDKATEPIDIDWNKQILWAHDLRVVAFRKSDLLQNSDEAIHQANYLDPRQQDDIPFFFDLSKLSKLTNKEIPEIQQALRDLQLE